MKLNRILVILTTGLFLSPGLLFAERVTLMDGTPVRLRLKADLISDRAKERDRVDFEVAEPVVVNRLVVIPQGATAWGAVQGVKKDKFVRFDVVAVRLPNQMTVKLRISREKGSPAGKGDIRVENDLGNKKFGANQGSVFTAYVAETIGLEAAPAEGTPPSPAKAAPPTAAPSPAETLAASVASSQQAPAVELITVECTSDPSGAEIYIDGDFYGSTASFLKVPVGSHQVEYKLPGYKTYSTALDLASGAGYKTVKASLEKRE